MDTPDSATRLALRPLRRDGLGIPSVTGRNQRGRRDGLDRRLPRSTASADGHLRGGPAWFKLYPGLRSDRARDDVITTDSNEAIDARATELEERIMRIARDLSADTGKPLHHWIEETARILAGRAWRLEDTPGGPTVVVDRPYRH